MLATLVLTVFGMAQNSGPQSAIVRFHEAVASGNQDRISAMIEGSPEEREARQIVQLINQLMRQGFGFNVVEVRQQGRNAVALVQYGAMNQRFYTISFALVMRGNQWRIDSAETYRLNSGTSIRM